MFWAAFFQNLGRNALAIIPNSQPERPFSIADFGFNVAGTGVPERIAQRLPRDAVDLVSDDRVQVPWRTFHHQIESCGPPDSSFR
jgi:hypothetical protein